MRFVYVAKHSSGHNDDEGAITHALRELGHSVEPIREDKGRFAIRFWGDILLFHKWSDMVHLRAVGERMPRVFWYFDLVDTDDQAVASRCNARRAWMESTLPNVELGFCTDGDWVARVNGCSVHGQAADRAGPLADPPGPLVWLAQGADERVVGKAHGLPEPCRIDLLFVGSVSGATRQSFVAEMQARYGGRFVHVKKGIHGRELKDLVASARIVVAPDGPVTDRYWSNRVYLMQGFGAFLLHPWCARLAALHYPPHGTNPDSNSSRPGTLCYYRDRDELHRKIEYYLARPEERAAVSNAALSHTVRCHLYRHRCEELVRVIRERGLA